MPQDENLYNNIIYSKKDIQNVLLYKKQKGKPKNEPNLIKKCENNTHHSVKKSMNYKKNLNI